MPKPIMPHIWFVDGAEEAMNYYTRVFPNSRVISIERYPDASLDPHFAGMQGKVISGIFELNGQKFACLDGGKQGFALNEAISFIVECKNQGELDYYWERLSDGTSEQCGWCKDRFGVHWQIIPENMAALQMRPEQIQAMMGMKKIDIAALEAAGENSGK